MKLIDPRSKDEFANRMMDRMMATATYGDQPDRPTRQTVISAPTLDGRRASIAITLADTEAVIDEMELDAPCGICHANPCSWRVDRGVS